MSDLGAIFHVKKDGTQYDAHAYTTTDECPSPNLKVQIDATTGYVKLSEEENNPEATPIRVHVNSSGKTLKVLKTAAAPTGSLYCNGKNNTFTVPSGIRVLSIEIVGYEYWGAQYVGVTPGKTYKNLNSTEESYDEGVITQAYVTRGNYPNEVFWASVGDTGNEILGASSIDFTIKWSPEINKKTPSYTDY